MTSTTFKTRLMTGSIIGCAVLASTLMSQTAAAQTAPAPAAAEESAQVEELVVTGFRSSLSKALDVKRNNIGAVDAIMAEDIAAFPDQNLAEAIQRLPGVTISRVAGEGSQISVRGLGADFTRVRINGVDSIAAAAGNRSRGFDFNIFASELFNSITVRKTQSADVSEGSLGATVDLQTGRPFDYKGFKAAASAQGSINSITDKTLPRLAGLMSWSNPDQTFGILGSVAYSRRRPVNEGFNTTRWQGGASDGGDNFAGCLTCTTPAQLAAVNSAFYPRIPRYTASEIDSKRLGITGSVQWQPSPRTRFDLDVLYSKLNQYTESPNLEAISFSRSGNAASTGVRQTIVRDYAIDNNTFTYGVFDRVDVRSENGTQRDNTKFTQVTLAGQHEFSDRLRMKGRIGVANSDYQMPEQISFQLDRNDVNGYTYDARGDSRKPIINYGFDVANPALFTLTEMRSRESSILNITRTAVGEVEYDVDDALTLKAGVNAQQFVAKYRDASRNQTLTGGRQIVGVGAFSKVVTFGRDFPFPGGDRTYVVADIDKALAATNLLSFPLVVAAGDTRDVAEDDISGYGQAVVDTTVLGGMPLRSDFGFRVAKTKIVAQGFVNTAYVTQKNDYTDVLPSMNLSLEPHDGVMLRLGVAKVMARPTLASLTPGGTVGATSRTVSFGNTDLEPFRATNYDFSAEWYFQPEALLSVSLFYKKIDSFIAQSSSQARYGDLGLPLSLLNGTQEGPDSIFQVTTSINGSGGTLKGVEFQYQQPFTFLPEMLKGFGFIGNIAFVESDVNYGTALAPNRNKLTGQSDQTYNATLYYERGPFSARVSAAHRSGFLTTYPGQNDNTEGGTHGSTYFDASMSYKVRENLTVSLEGINLGDEYTDAYVDESDRVNDYRHTGREILFGVRWTY
jgi:TonB-dependent receptor